MAGMTEEQLTTIRERWGKVTPGPWKYTASQLLTSVQQVEDPCIAIMYDPHYENDLANAKANGKAIAAAPTDIAALLEEIERLNHIIEKD